MTDVITISGQPGSGTTTVAEALVDQYDAAYVNGGTIFRALADEHGMGLDEFSKHVNENPAIDREIDEQLRQTVEMFLNGEDTGEAANQEGDTLSIDIDVDHTASVLVLESRLAGWIAGEDASLRVWCHAPVDIRCARITDAGSRKEKASELIERQQDEAMRYDEWYDINISDTSIYDAVLNTSRWDPATIVDLISTMFDEQGSDADEGASPTESPFV